MTFTEKEMMPVKQEDMVQLTSDVQAEVSVTAAQGPDMSVSHIMEKRRTRNAYMKKYRAHQRLLPTYAVLTRFRSPIKFSTSSGIRCNAEIFNGDLHVRLHHDTSLCEDHISFLPACPVQAKKIVAMAMIRAYKI